MGPVSVIIPAYNESDSITDAIDSVLGQTYTDLELIVVDDCSSDDTPQVVQAYSDPRVTYIRHGRNQGASAARNTGIDVAGGDYIALLDSDDTWHPTKLEKQVSCLASRSDEWIAVYCDAEYESDLSVDGIISRYLYRNEENRGIEGSEELIQRLITGEASVAAGSTLLAKSEYVREIGGFDEEFARHQDWEFLIRLLEHGKCAYVDEKLVTVKRAGSPSPDREYEAKMMFLEKFAPQIARHPLSARTIENQHRYLASKLYLQNGEFKRAYEVLPDVRHLTLLNYLGLVVSVYRYVARRVWS